MRRPSRRPAPYAVAITLALAARTSGQEPVPPATAPAPDRTATEMPRTVIRGEADHEGVVAQPFLEDVEGDRIYAGKKASVIDFDALPQIQTDNYRQAFSRTPGLLISELSNASLLSIGYRGVGDPHESQNLLVLKDGIPFVVDLYGYPTVYYAPPFESVDRLEFVRGGASLLYGPQPSGALNYVTHQPRRDREFSLRTQHVFGSYDLYTTHTLMDGTVGRLGYLVSYDHRQGDAFRRLNSDFELNGGSVRLVLDADRDTRWTLDFDATSADSGEPGGLTHARGPGLLTYEDDRQATQNVHDRVRVQRYIPSLTLAHDFNPDTTVTARAWGGYYERYSKRQRQTGGPAFGSVGTLIDSNTITEHRYYTFGTDTRLRHDWQAWGEAHTLTGGVGSYYVDAPLDEDRGATASADTGTARKRSQRQTISGSVFAENLFNFGRLSVVPGFRLENMAQDIRETLNLDKTTSPLLSDERLDVVPLVALGATWRLDPSNQIYGNVSQGYKAATYTDAVPLNNGTVVSDTLEPGQTWTYEAGFRGTPWGWLTYDASLFLIDYDDRFGSVTLPGGVTRMENVGRSVNRGVDLALELDVIGLADRLRGTDHAAEWGSLGLYGNASLLDAEFVSGTLDGRTPQYAPDHIIRTGVTYRLRDRVRLAFLGTFVDTHYANDNNTAQFRIPAYMVWDLTAEVAVWRDNVRLLAGLNNVFDEDYYSRIRSNGIDPAVGRNFYAGLSLAF